MMEKILITGSSGFIGKELCKKLKDSSEIFGFSRLGNILIENGVTGDILKYSDVDRAVRGMTTVIHLVASSDQRLKSRVIIAGTRNIIQACKKYKVKKLVFLSSYAASRVNKDSTGIAKLQAEEDVKNSGLNYIILRPTLIYGKGGRVFRSIIATTLFPMVAVMGNGKNKIGPVFIDDLIRIILLILDKKYSSKTYSIIGDIVTYNDFIQEILKVQQERKKLIHIPLTIIRALVLILSTIHVLKYNNARIARATEDVCIDEYDVRKEIPFKFTSLGEGLSKSIDVL